MWVGGQNDPLALIPSIFIKTFQKKKSKTVANFLGMIIIAIGGTENGHPLFEHCIVEKEFCTQKLWPNEKKNYLEDLSPKHFQKVLMKIDEMADVFLNSTNFAQHAFLTLAPTSGYILNLKALIKVSKINWTSQLSYKVLWS